MYRFGASYPALFIFLPITICVPYAYQTLLGVCLFIRKQRKVFISGCILPYKLEFSLVDWLNEIITQTIRKMTYIKNKANSTIISSPKMSDTYLNRKCDM